MTAQVSPAYQPWLQAKKLRKHLLKQLEKLGADKACATDTKQFEMLDDTLGQLRLACVQTIFLDFEYAVSQNAEQTLWALHTSINSEYRRTLGLLKHSSRVVEKRKVEKLYGNFLRIAQKFYKGYIQRLAALYDIPELKRVAEGVHVEQVAAEDAINQVPAPLHDKVLKSCHSTLIRLGDLARYRVQAKTKKTGYETALTYYSLAHELLPGSGYGSHQMGIINLEEGNHLEVVYNFYRSLTVKEPHPMAKSNLEAEFRKLQLPSSSNSRKNTNVTEDAFVMWFLRLHALTYKGEVFTQHAELEREVLHRLEKTAERESCGDTLFKMMLVNISAHYAAVLSYTETNTEPALRFRQYALRLNLQFFETLCRVLESEIREHHDLAQDLDDHPERLNTSNVTTCLLPILRIYVIWFATYRTDAAEASMDPAGFDMTPLVQTIGKLFTALCAEKFASENLVSCPYLLHEDAEIRGFEPLSIGRVPEACRSFCDEDGKMKPYLSSFGQKFDPAQESLARVLDLLRCAYFLAEDGAIPLGYRVEANNLIFEMQLGGRHSQPVDSSNATYSLTDNAQTAATDLRAADRAVRDYPSPDYSKDGPGAETQPSFGQIGLEKPGFDTTSAADSNVIDMLSPFLKPPTPVQHGSNMSPIESSYGMHTATANDLFASYRTEMSTNESLPSGKFEQLPWNWLYTPTPLKTQGGAEGMGRDAFHGRHGSRQSSKSSQPSGGPFEDPFSTPGMRSASTFSPRNVHEQPNPAAAAAETHRNNLLQSFTNISDRRPLVPAWPSSEVASSRFPDGSPATLWNGQGQEAQPTSSTGSAFSHPSSLYQGTPAPVLQDGSSGVQLGNQPQHGQGRGNANRQFRMDSAASRYDSAILNAALVNK